MKVLNLILGILGAAFVAIGGIIGAIFIVAFGGFDIFVAIPFLFVVIGLCFIGAVVYMNVKNRLIIKKGTKHAAKIYGYVKNTSYTVNDHFTNDTKVRFFDSHGIIKEAVIPTGFADGAETYPIGMTMDIYEYKGKFNFDAASVRNERLYREEELMDDKPVDPAKLRMVAVKCNNCGASFKAADGYAAKCPYCDGFINA